MNKNKKDNKGCLSGILGTLLVIIGVILYALLSSHLNKLLFSTRFGDSAECALLPMFIISIIAVFILLEIIFLSWQLKLWQKGSDSEVRFNKIFKIILISSLSLILVFSTISFSTYTKLDDDGISSVFFAEYERYDIESDVARCTLACSDNGQLTYTLTMNDGKKIELFGTVNSCGKGFIDKYESMYGYAAHVTEKYVASSGLPPRVIGAENMENTYKDAHPDIWKYLEMIIEESK